MSRKSRRFGTDSANSNRSSNQISGLFGNDAEPPESPARTDALKGNRKTRLLYPVVGFSLLILLALGVMAGNGWLPHTDALSGKRTGWFGRDLQSNNVAANAGSNSINQSSLLPFEPMPTATPTPQLSKEYIYAGSRMLAVEDAGANAAPPTDLAVWRPSNGNWYVLNSQPQQWGNSSLQDMPVPGDYDGDGRTDFAVYRQSNSNWFISYTSGSSAGFAFGSSGDIPAPADFDGDGKTDAAVFRPGNGTWYYYRSSDNGFVSLQFGLSGDVPVPRDFDGDGKADITVWRPSAGTFYTLRSSDSSVQSQAGGQSSDVQVSADYDGDGRADYAIRRGADWIYVQSSDGATQIVSWQQARDTAVQNDYDADGKVDIAVWRDATGMWYIRQSSRIGQSNELRQVQWGMSGDTPVPAFYRR